MSAFLVTAALLFPTAAAAPAAAPAPAPAPAAPAPAAPAPAAPAPEAAPAPAAPAPAAPAMVAPAVAPDPEELPRSAGPDALVEGYDVPVPGPARSGFTLEGSIGLGFTRISPEDDDYDGLTKSGLSGLNLAIGGFVSPRTALTFRIAGTLFIENDATFTAVFAGPAVQHYVGERAFIGAGLGLGVLDVNTDGGDDAGAAENGLGLDLRVGYDIASSRTGALHVAFEVTPGFYDDGMVTGVGFQIGAQLF